MVLDCQSLELGLVVEGSGKVRVVEPVVAVELLLLLVVIEGVVRVVSGCPVVEDLALLMWKWDVVLSHARMTF